MIFYICVKVKGNQFHVVMNVNHLVNNLPVTPLPTMM